MATEQIIQRRIQQYLKTVPNCWYVKVMSANKIGVPDILCCINGQFFAFEVKTDAGQASPMQIHQLNNLRESGAIAVVVRSVDDVSDAIFCAELKKSK